MNIIKVTFISLLILLQISCTPTFVSVDELRTKHDGAYEFKIQENISDAYSDVIVKARQCWAEESSFIPLANEVIGDYKDAAKTAGITLQIRQTEKNWINTFLQIDMQAKEEGVTHITIYHQGFGFRNHGKLIEKWLKEGNSECD
jgi:hypothetical protein